MSAITRLAEFVASADIPNDARAVARDAFQDTVGVMLAGVVEPAARIVQKVARVEAAPGSAGIYGTNQKTGASWAALANGTAAHALDFDDMCWITMAHPSAPLVAAALSAAESSGASGRVALDAYVAGFEVEAVLGRALNPSHYDHGWHATSTIGTIGAAAAAARVLGLDTDAIGRALSIAASEASGLKENFGTMVKPLHAGLAARNGVLAALLAREGFTASDRAIDGPQGFRVAMRSSEGDISELLAKLGRRWEILDGGITFKLYPSCAATHPTIDTLLDLRREHAFDPADVVAVEVDVDPVTPTVLIYDRPVTGLQGKFSLHFCAAAALATGRIGIETFALSAMKAAAVDRLVPLVTMRVDERLGPPENDAPPLTQARVRIRLVDGRTLERFADGARGYPRRPATGDELDAKFTSCATRSVSKELADRALGYLQDLEVSSDLRGLSVLLTDQLVPQPVGSQ